MSGGRRSLDNVEIITFDSLNSSSLFPLDDSEIDWSIDEEIFQADCRECTNRVRRTHENLMAAAKSNLTFPKDLRFFRHEGELKNLLDRFYFSLKALSASEGRGYPLTEYKKALNGLVSCLFFSDAFKIDKHTGKLIDAISLWSKITSYIAAQLAAGLTLEKSIAGGIFNGLTFGLKPSLHPQSPLKLLWIKFSHEISRAAIGVVDVRALFGIFSESAFYTDEADEVLKKCPLHLYFYNIGVDEANQLVLISHNVEPIIITAKNQLDQYIIKPDPALKELQNRWYQLQEKERKQFGSPVKMASTTNLLQTLGNALPYISPIRPQQGRLTFPFRSPITPPDEKTPPIKRESSQVVKKLFSDSPATEARSFSLSEREPSLPPFKGAKRELAFDSAAENPDSDRNHSPTKRSKVNPQLPSIVNSPAEETLKSREKKLCPSTYDSDDPTINLSSPVKRGRR